MAIQRGNFTAVVGTDPSIRDILNGGTGEDVSCWD